MKVEFDRKLNKISLNQRVIEDWTKLVFKSHRDRSKTEKDLSQDKRLKTLIRKSKGALLDLWSTYTKERESLGFKVFKDRSQVLTYLLGFHLPNLQRMNFILGSLEERVNLRETFSEYEKIDIFDFGCGTGALSHQFLNYLPASLLDRTGLHLIDQNKLLIDVAEGFSKLYLSEESIRKHRFLLQDLHVGKDSLFTKSFGEKSLKVTLLGYVWNELAKSKFGQSQLEKFFDVCEKSKQDHLIFVLDPVSEDKSRSLMALRDRLVNTGYRPLFPCPSQKDWESTSCPMLERTRDWCYSEEKWDKPRIQDLIDEQINISRKKLAVTAFVFASSRLTQKLNQRKENFDVVVGKPLEKTGFQSEAVQKFKYLLCDGKSITNTPLISIKSQKFSRGDIYRKPARNNK